MMKVLVALDRDDESIRGQCRAGHANGSSPVLCYVDFDVGGKKEGGFRLSIEIEIEIFLLLWTLDPLGSESGRTSRATIENVEKDNYATHARR